MAFTIREHVGWARFPTWLLLADILQPRKRHGYELTTDLNRPTLHARAARPVFRQEAAQWNRQFHGLQNENGV